MNWKDLYKLDKCRYTERGINTCFIYHMRRALGSSNLFLKFSSRIILNVLKDFCGLEISYKTQIGKGFYIGHPYGITVNPNAIIGDNCNIHKGVVIGQENRGKRKGAPIIGNEVWIGINSAIVGKITIGDDVLIAPNSYVNCDVPSHSIVFGNPCIVRHKDYATKNYINRKV